MVLAIVVSFQTAHSVFSDRDLCGLSQLLTNRIRMILVKTEICVVLANSSLIVSEWS